MASFLRRSKSTRDHRLKARDQQELPFTSRDLLTTRKARVPPIIETGPASAIGTTTTVTTGPSHLIKLARRKSISSTRESKMALGIPETWEPPITPNTATTPAERKRRTSIFFGLATPPVHAPPLVPSPPQPKRAAPPPPIKLSAFPPRASSRNGSSPVVSRGSEVGVALGDETYIGMALGSPSESTKVASENSTFASMNSVSSQSPAFVLPSTPFGIQEPPKTARENTHENYREHTRAKTTKAPEYIEEPKTAGWRKRIFGKGLFSKRGAVKHLREPTPEMLEYKSSPVPHLVKKKVKDDRIRTPCLDVQIPSVEMERYSVMFDTLLHPSEKSSLYHRRKSRDVVGAFNGDDTDLGPLDALSSLNGEKPQVSRLDVRPLKRNATTGSHISPRSPLSRLGDDLRRISSDSRRSRSRSPCRSPGLSPTIPPPSPGLARAQTSAADGRPPPSPSPYGAPLPVYTHNEMLSPPPLSYASNEQVFDFPEDAPENIEGDEIVSSRISRISEESSIDTPRGSFDTGDDEWMTREDETEPMWEMVTKPSTTQAKQPDSVAAKNEGSAPVISHGVSVNIGDDFTDEDLDEITIAAQISIARQISVSQRQLLLPVVPKNQRLVSRKSIREPMKPRLVEHRVSTMPAAAKRPAESAEFATAV